MKSPLLADFSARVSAVMCAGPAARTALLAVALIGGGCQNLQTPVPMLQEPPDTAPASGTTPGAGSGEASGIPAPEVLAAAALDAFSAAKVPPGGVRPAGAPDVIHATATAAFRAAIAPAVARGFTSAAASTAALSAAAHAAAKATAVVLGRDTSSPSAYAIVGAIANEAYVAASAAGYPGYPTGQNFEGAAMAGLSEILGFGVGASQAVATAAPRGAGGGSGGGRPTAPRKEFTLVGVLYATDRKPLMPLADWKRDFPGKKDSNYAYFGGEPDASGRLHFGLCTVSVPVSHKPGALERPEWLRTEDLVTHITIRGLFELDEAGMRRRITSMSEPDNDVFIFIHGFNVKFNEAAMRAAQIAYDFKFLGAPILYSWSSAGTLEGYQHDQENVSQTEEKLLEFIEAVVRERGAGKVHLIAHSMGNRALVAVLKDLARKGSGKLFGEVVLAAPDVPLGAFRATDADNVRKLADRISLYASSDDKALKLSQAASTHSRLGLSGKDLFVTPGIETIDASGVDTDLLSLSHTYFANARKVLDDLAAVLVHRARPDAAPRNLFKKLTTDNRVFWSVLK